MNYKKLPKEALCELLFNLGMQAQSQRMTQSEGRGVFNSAKLEKAIRKNKKIKNEIIKILIK